VSRASRGQAGAVCATFSGFCATLVGIGLARFAYTPLIPALIAAEWFAPTEAAYLGAANLAGYLAGALVAQRLAGWARPAVVLRGMMLATAAALFACAVPLSFLWFFLWRFAAGLCGGTLMVLAAPNVLPRIPPARRGLAGGVIFTGVGLGIAASGTLVPLLLQAGLAATWCGLGILALSLTLLAWGGWPAVSAKSAAAVSPPAPRPRNPALLALFLAYALNALGIVPHMIFLVDFVARGLGQGLAAGARDWVLFGLGAMAGPALAGAAADRIGFAWAVRISYAVEAIAVGLAGLTESPLWLGASSAVIGAFTPGITALVLGRIHELVPAAGAGREEAWRISTVAFALGQAAGAYGFSLLFSQAGSYLPLFGCGAAALLLALALDVAVALNPRAGRPAASGC